jgi:F0F1-type ATP synthase membrane subunit b/b'
MKLRTIIGWSAALALYASPALAAEGAERGGLPWFSLLLYVINFALFAAVLVYFAGPIVRRFFSERAQTIRSELARLEAALREAEDSAGRAAARSVEIEPEIQRLRHEIDVETAYQVGKIREAAAAASAQAGRDTEMTIAALIDGSRRRIRERMAASAVGLARDLILKGFGTADQHRLVEGFMEKLREEATR